MHNLTKPIRAFYREIQTAENNDQSTTRWGLVQLLVAIALFCFGIALGFLSLALYFLEHAMCIAITCFVLMVIFAGVGLFVIFKALALASAWLSKGSTDPTATKQDLGQLKQDLLSETAIIVRQNLKKTLDERERLSITGRSARNGKGKKTAKTRGNTQARS